MARIMDKLISFALPLMLSGILQLMFNAVDIIVVGRFSGSEALAAVGSTTALINVFTNLFMGISLGANVLAAQMLCGWARKKKCQRRYIQSITLALISGIGMAVIGLLFARGALELMGTPDDVIEQSTLYMRIYFLWHAVFYAVQLRCCNPAGGWRYEASACVPDYLRSGECTAESWRWSLFFHLGVAGVAIATVISQMISCVLVLLCLICSDGPLSVFRFPKLKMNQLLPAADLSGRDSCGHPEHGYQYFQCDAPVVG